MTDIRTANGKAPWIEPKLEALDVDLESIATGNVEFIDGSSTQNKAQHS